MFKDSKSNLLKEGDTILMTIKGAGTGEVQVVSQDNILYINDDHSGLYPLSKAIERADMVLTKKDGNN